MKQIRGTVATRMQYDEMHGKEIGIVDCWKVLNEYSNMTRIPEKFGFGRAAELQEACRWAIFVIKNKFPFNPPKEENE